MCFAWSLRSPACVVKSCCTDSGWETSLMVFFSGGCSDALPCSPHPGREKGLAWPCTAGQTDALFASLSTAGSIGCKTPDDLSVPPHPGRGRGCAESLSRLRLCGPAMSCVCRLAIPSGLSFLRDHHPHTLVVEGVTALLGIRRMQAGESWIYRHCTSFHQALAC